MCVMELLSLNVSISKVEPTIRSVLKLAGVQCDRLPQHTFINDMLIESRAVAHVQLAEELSTIPINPHTLHSDGTTKFGHKYVGYQVSTENNQSYSLGLRETVSGCSNIILDTLKEILADIEQCIDTATSTTTKASKKILANIANTMSDRASNQKCFNEMLQDYRENISPRMSKDRCHK